MAGPTSASVRVVLADDHAPVRELLAEDLEAAGFEVVASVADGPAAVAAALRERPDICLLDVHMPGGGGVAAAWEITGGLPGAKVVMLTTSRDEEDAVAALRAGAIGYLLKDVELAGLPVTLRRILDGDAVLPRGAVDRLLAESTRRRRWSRAHVPELSEGESRLLEQVGAGRPVTDIAADLALGPDDVRGRVATLLGKFRAESGSSLAVAR